MINNLIKKISKTFKPRKSTPETRVALKNKLDYFASGRATIQDFQNCLVSGQPRVIVISNNEIRVHLEETDTQYVWQLGDPRTAIACLGVVGEYELIETRILKFFAAKSELIIDVGANVGYYAVELSAMLTSTAKIHAFEPVPESFQQLKRNVNLNSLSTVVSCNQVAISNSDSNVLLYKPKTSGSSASSARNLHPEEDVEEILVHSTTLDNYISLHGLKSLNLLKIDVEGAELMVIEGALNSIRTHKPVIFAELLRKWSAQFGYHPNDVLDVLKTLGYQCFAVSGSLPKIDNIDGDTKETNFLFVPLERIEVMDELLEEVKRSK